MPSCANGHVQKFGLKCDVCGADVSYKSAAKELLALPSVQPDYGGISLLRVGFPGVLSRVDYSASVTIGEEERADADSFIVPRIHGGNWLEFKSRYQTKLTRWLKMVGFEKSKHRIVIMDTSDPLSVLAVAAIPNQAHTLVVAISADPDSTPVEQSNSYAAISIATKRGFPLIALGASYTRDLLFYSEEGGFATHADAVSKIVGSLIQVLDDTLDLTERDLRLGGKLHYIATIISGSKTVYANTGDALVVEQHNLSIEPKPEDVRMLHGIIMGGKHLQAEFTKNFTQFRTKNFKTAISAEARFFERPGEQYDLVMICGLGEAGLLGSLAEGYNTVKTALPELDVEAVA